MKKAILVKVLAMASPLSPNDPFVLIWNDPWDAQLLRWQF